MNFNKLVSHRPAHILDLMKEHPNIIHSDVDALWLQDPRPYFEGNGDFFAQLDGVIEGAPYFQGYLPYFCTGFLAIRKTKSIVDLLNAWKTELEIQVTGSDQVLFNSLVHKLNIDGKPLPMTKFACGTLYFEQMPEKFQKQVVVVHNNFVQGLQFKVKVSIHGSGHLLFDMSSDDHFNSWLM